LILIIIIGIEQPLDSWGADVVEPLSVLTGLLKALVLACNFRFVFHLLKLGAGNVGAVVLITVHPVGRGALMLRLYLLLFSDVGHEGMHQRLH
jgi:hypothetical protein